MPLTDKYELRKQKCFIVQCSNDPTHTFEKVLVVLEDVEGEPPETDVECYCPYCSTMVSFTVKGTPANDTELHRRFEEQDRRLKR